MSEALQQFHFLRHWWLLALVALPLLFWFGVRRSSVPELSRLVDAELLPHLLRGRAANRYMPAVAVRRGLDAVRAGAGRPDLESRGAAAVRESRSAGRGDLAVAAHAVARRGTEPARSRALQGA
jgi:Ca-activated chloride channel family protein